MPNKTIKAKKQLAAVTLIEVILAVAILGLIIAMILPFGRNYLLKSELEDTTKIITMTIENAKANAKTGNRDGAWGVYLTSKSITLFQGASYSVRNTTYDLTTSWSGQVTATGLQEVVFGRLDGDPGTTGTITISNGVNSKNITINAKGNVLY